MLYHRSTGQKNVRRSTGQRTYGQLVEPYHCTVGQLVKKRTVNWSRSILLSFTKAKPAVNWSNPPVNWPRNRRFLGPNPPKSRLKVNWSAPPNPSRRPGQNPTRHFYSHPKTHDLFPRPSPTQPGQLVGVASQVNWSRNVRAGQLVDPAPHPPILSMVLYVLCPSHHLSLPIQSFLVKKLGSQWGCLSKNR